MSQEPIVAPLEERQEPREGDQVMFLTVSLEKQGRGVV